MNKGGDHQMSQRSMLWCAVLILLAATALRATAFGDVPPGLYHDEAYHGLDVIALLEGNGGIPLYFPANNGREPLFIYLVAATVGLLGRSPFALRLAALPVGVLTVAATIAMGRALFSHRVGVLSGAALAVTLWHVHLSRVGFRTGLLPLFTALAVWQVAAAINKGKDTGRSDWHWIAAGACYALAFYTYTAARFTVVAVGAFALYVLVFHPAALARHRPHHRRGVALAGLAFSVVIAPLAIYTLTHTDVVLGRTEQVAVWSPAIHHGDFWRALGAHTLRTLGMFFVRGDRIWRHNVPWRPVFDPALGLAFVVGAVIAARRALRPARRDAAAGFCLIWIGVMSLPTLLAEDAPHFLRAVGVLPVAVLLPALGLDRLSGMIRRPAARRTLLALALTFSLNSTARAYFFEYARDPMSGYWFERGAEALAGRINAFLGHGWDGARMQHRQGETEAAQVYLARALWEEWRPQLRFLVAEPASMMVGLTPADDDPPAPRVAVFTWPYGEWRQAWDLLPAPAEITVEKGPLSQGDNDPQPFTTYLAFYAAPLDDPPPAIARFSGGVELLDVRVTPISNPEGDERLRVRFQWRASAPLAADYTIFVHYLRDGERVAQGDSRAAYGYYPTSQWRPGDVIYDEHDLDDVIPLPERDLLRFGFWDSDSGQKLHLLDEAGNPTADWMDIPAWNE